MSIDCGDLEDINKAMGLELDLGEPVGEPLPNVIRAYRCAALTGLLARNTGEPMEAIAQLAALVGDRMAELER